MWGTTHLGEINWAQQNVDRNNKMDPSLAQYVKIEGQCENGDDHLHVFVTVPSNNFCNNAKASRLIVYFPSVGSENLYQDMAGKP